MALKRAIALNCSFCHYFLIKIQSDPLSKSAGKSSFCAAKTGAGEGEGWA